MCVNMVYYYLFNTYKIKSYTINNLNQKTSIFKSDNYKFEATYGYVNSSESLLMDQKRYNRNKIHLHSKDLKNRANTS